MWFEHRAVQPLPLASRVTTSGAYLLALLCPLLVWPLAAPFDVGTIDVLKLFPFGITQFGPASVRHHPSPTSQEASQLHPGMWNRCRRWHRGRDSSFVAIGMRADEYGLV